MITDPDSSNFISRTEEDVGNGWTRVSIHDDKYDVCWYEKDGNKMNISIIQLIAPEQHWDVDLECEFIKEATKPKATTWDEKLKEELDAGVDTWGRIERKHK